MPMREGIYGLLAEFDTPGELVAAAKTAYDRDGGVWIVTPPTRWKRRPR